MSNPIFLCAQQRSGTTLIQKALQASNLCKNYGEVFHDKYLHFNKEHSFFNYKKKLLSNNIKLCFPSVENQKFIFNKYTNFLKNEAGLPFHIIDIKYNSWHHFNPIWHNFETPPQLLSFVRKRTFKVIHIIRKNLLHQYISSIVSKETGLFHFKENAENSYENNKFEINLEHCKRTIRSVERNIDTYKRYFSNYPFYKEIYYEDLIVDNKFSNTINSIVAKFTDGHLTDLGSPILKKGIQDPFALIKNIDELVNNLKKTHFEVYL